MSATNPLHLLYIHAYQTQRLKPVWRMPSDPTQGFYGVMSSRPIVINESSLLCRSVNKFSRGLCHTFLVYCALDGHEIIAMQRVARFPF